MRRIPVAAALLVLGALAGCHTPGGTVTRQVIVEFDTSDSTAARPVVIADCSHLPGVTNSPTAAGDPNVILDYSHATTDQEEALIACVDGLQTSQKALQIRDIQVQDGTDN